MTRLTFNNRCRFSEAPTAVAKEQVVQLPAVAVTSAKEASFVDKTALSSARSAVDLVDLPPVAKVLNQAFLQAITPVVLTETLNYVGGL